MPTSSSRLALVASLAAASVASRVALAGGPPNVKPVAFFVIIGGVLGGWYVGFLTGLVSMMASDAYFGIGPWTAITSSMMGFAGAVAGILWHGSSKTSRVKLAVGGYLLTALYDVTTSLYDVVVFKVPLWASLAGLYAPLFLSSRSFYPFGLVHETTTALLLYAAGPVVINSYRNWRR